MDNALIINAHSGQRLSPPVQFQRIPMAGEFIWAPPRMFSVVRVVHGWANGPNPMASVHVELAPNHRTAGTTAGHISPF